MNYFTFENGKLTDLWLNDGSASGILEAARNDPDQCVQYCELDKRQAKSVTKSCKPYATNVFMTHALERISAHDGSKPMFLYVALQNTHGPSQVPTRNHNQYPDLAENSNLRYAYAMISALDDQIALLIEKLKEKGMWANTLLLFASDNGGKISEAPNYPLRGGKGSVFEGGVRVASFLAGGYLPSKVRGTRRDGLIHMCDWFSTFASLAGESNAQTAGYMDPKAEKSWSIPARVKKVDSLNMWPYLRGSVQSSPRQVVHLAHDPVKWGKSNGGIIWGRWKLIIGRFKDFVPSSPHDIANPQKWLFTYKNCGQMGCLFDLQTDELEERELQSNTAYADILTKMQGLYQEYADSHFQAHFIEGEDNEGAVAAAKSHNDGTTEGADYWCPWQSNLPEHAMTDRKFSHGDQDAQENPIVGLKDAQECHDVCKKEKNAKEQKICEGWQFKWGRAEEVKGKVKEWVLTEETNSCILFAKVKVNNTNPEIWIEEESGSVIGVRRAAARENIRMEDNLKWLDQSEFLPPPAP